MKLLKNKSGLIMSLLLAGINCFAQDSTGSEKKELQLNVAYYQLTNNIPYLLVTTKTKVERKFIGVKDLKVNVYLNDATDSNLIQSFQSNTTGEKRIYIPTSFKAVWDIASSFTFIAIAEANKEFDETKGEAQVTKAKIEIDTSRTDETKNITVNVKQLQNGEWIPAKDVELKIAVKRSLGNLPIGDEETYTTDPQPNLGFTRVIGAHPGVERNLVPERLDLLWIGNHWRHAMPSLACPILALIMWRPSQPSCNASFG